MLNLTHQCALCGRKHHLSVPVGPWDASRGWCGDDGELGLCAESDDWPELVCNCYGRQISCAQKGGEG